MNLPMENIVGFDNQQERLIGWFAGMVDADGSIGLHVQKFGTTLTYVPSISITTCCIKTKDVLSSVYRHLEVGYHITERRPSNQAWSKVWVFNTRGMKRAFKLLGTLIPILVTKHDEACIVMRFIDKRMQDAVRQPYGMFEHQCIAELKALKNRNQYASSETIRRAPNVMSGDDMVRTATKFAERGRNDLAS